MNNNTLQKCHIYLISIAALLLSTGCPVNSLDESDFETSDWTEATHSKTAAPNFAEVFDDTQVKRFDIVITAEHWQSMLDDMTNMYGTLGSGSIDSGSSTVTDKEDPVFVPAEIFYNGVQWYRVGVRFKGNSSLKGSWQSGILKLPFKLDFDEFEDVYPQIDDQRFFGFKKFSLKNNFKDKSFVREKMMADIFADAGVAVSHTAFYELFIDHGNGPEYFGLYTLVEEVDNTVIKTQFSDDDGNLYKPEGFGASFAERGFFELHFEKKTNEDEKDWSDIKALFAILHDERRTSDPVNWRADLNAIFDTDAFLKYLAVNTVAQNWDSYGRKKHNYYLYNNPENGLLTWIPWDHNEALKTGKSEGALPLDFSDLESGAWPLIEYLYNDDVYKARYDVYVANVAAGAFEPNYIQQVYTFYSNLIEASATSERPGYSFLDNNDDFYDAITQLNEHVTDRAAAVEDYLNP